MSEAIAAAGRVARKEFRGFFASPAAWLFLGAFLLVSLFVVFWVERFFARNLADLRPLFEWMPLLLIFLVAALTMRSWAEERRAGTLESLLTAPLAPLALVMGKFLAALGLVALALLLTLPLAVSVSLLGPLDWGPVIGGYLASLCLGAAYVAIGLAMSGRTDNPVVALILTVLVCGAFYLIGSPGVTALFGHETGSLLAALGSGSRFDAITRGVIDLRDLAYYVSLVGVFLAWNLYSLERLRWAGNPGGPRHRRRTAITLLVAANFLALNLWLEPLHGLRLDLTEGRLYTLSEATREQLEELQEPLQIRGYFSARTHPLLAPLVPQLKDLLQAYADAAGARARVHFINPTRDPEAEEEAAARYGIRPVPFQSADRYQASVVSSWFDVVIAYGDQYETLNYEDLVEIRARSESDLDVALKDPEYTLTRTIRKLAGSWRAEGELFAGLSEPVVFHGWMSPTDQLPGVLGELRGELETLLADKAAASAGLLQVEFADPEAGDGALAERLEQVYGLVPQVAGLLDPQPFWFYMVLESQGEVIQIPLPESLASDELERSLDNALRRFTPGALNTVGVVKPVGSGPATRFSQLEATLADNARVRHVDLARGQVPVDTDLLLVLAPEALDETERFAIDQYLMRGGSVILSTSPFTVDASTTLAARRLDSGLGEWLAHQGIRVQEQMVLDPRNAAMPVPVERTIGGIPIREISLLDYPHFPDVRGDGLNPDNPATAGLGQLTLNWVSPLQLNEDAEGAGSRHSEWLLRSSADSWLSDSLDILPGYQVHPANGYPVNGERGAHLLAVALEGRFTSFWQDKPSPLAKTSPAPEETLGGEETAESTGSAGPGAPAREAGAAATPEDSDGNLVNLRTVIERSPESARLVVIGSNSFASDLSLDLASQGQGAYYMQPLAFVQNLVDWALEDSSLLELRGRSRMARTLDPIPEEAQRFWEGLNYAMALVGLCLVWLWRRQVLLADYRRYRQILAEV